MTPQRLLFLGTPEDEPFSVRLKPIVGQATVYTLYSPISTLVEVIMYCKKRNITGVFSTNTTLLSKLLSTIGNAKSNPSLDNYAGSYFSHQDIEFIFIHPLDQLTTIPYGPFLTRRLISKLISPETWKNTPEFNWKIVTATNVESIYEKYKSAFAIAVDIETLKENLVIRCVGYTAVFIDSNTGKIATHSCVLPIDSDFALSWMRKFNWELKAPKILQNGKYDISYFIRYNAVLYNYMFDTATMFHCWYSELPKDLAFLSAFFIRKAMYWKDLANTEDLHQYYKYNALDTYGTAIVFISWILESPEWAKRNYEMEFPLLFPCILSEGTGIKRDMEQLKIAREEIDKSIEEDNISLSKMVGAFPNLFNVNSAPQNIALRKILGCEDIKSSDELHLKKIASRHPLNRRIANKILDIRGNRKSASTYLRTDADIKKPGDRGGKELNGRILYSINPHGTDTGRLASREHHFWCGLQIQNITRGPEVKCTLIADEGFRIAECDLKQAESRGTAYISGDKNLIAAVSSERDFHSINASAFFGIPYEDIYSDKLGKTLNKNLRDLAKRVNHGANYLMGAFVLIDTMGEEKVWEAKRLLKTPICQMYLEELIAKKVFNPKEKAEASWKQMGLKEVAEYLLDRFHKTYPGLSSTFYPGVVNDVMTKKMLVGATGWTRYCFGNPRDNKQHKNAYVAHVPQSINAMVLNKAYLKVFYDIAIHPTHAKNFKLCAQIHDSILFQFRQGHEYLCGMVRERMEIPVKIMGYDGIEREFTVPADIKAGTDGLGAVRWSETE